MDAHKSLFFSFLFFSFPEGKAKREGYDTCMISLHDTHSPICGPEPGTFPHPVSPGACNRVIFPRDRLLMSLGTSLPRQGHPISSFASVCSHMTCSHHAHAHMWSTFLLPHDTHQSDSSSSDHDKESMICCISANESHADHIIQIYIALTCMKE